MTPSLEEIPYGTHALQTITVAKPYPAPPHNDDRSSYWVILIHGGAWRDPSQTSSSYLTPALNILSSSPSSESSIQNKIIGYASISYRLSPHPSYPQDPSTESPNTLRAASHPDHISDVIGALSVLEERYKIGNRYILVGHSCGATLAFQAVMRSVSYSFSSQAYPLPVAILGMAGIYDLRKLRDAHKDISAYQEFIEGAFGADEVGWDAASPGVVRGEEGVEGWDEGRVVVLAHSEGDGLCDVAQSEGMRRSLGEWDKDRERGEREVHFLSIEGEHDEAWEKGGELAKGILFTLARLQEMGV
ncbi:Alpha/Beta hydrolase protein [Aspergillus cavernicola]|uniref:Kynurenine formamidase n=1 Tax=Aspergillus cavernicola TaxID=176166 RepID=A0ABR4IWD8_9EURO